MLAPFWLSFCVGAVWFRIRLFFFAVGRLLGFSISLLGQSCHLSGRVAGLELCGFWRVVLVTFGLELWVLSCLVGY